MTRLVLVSLAVLLLFPTLAFGRPATDFEAVAFLSKDAIQVGQKIQIIASEFGDLTACGESYTTVYRGAIAEEFGGARKIVQMWGSNLKGLYTVEKLWTGEGEATCALLTRVSPK